MQIIGSVQSHIKIWFFWNVKTYSCIYLKWVHPINVAKEALDRNSWIFDADHWFSSKSRQNMIFWNVKAIPVSIWNNFTPNVATEASDRSSWILDAGHWFSSKSHENMVFVKSYSCFYLKWVHSKNMATEPLDRNSWILVADHRFSSKSRENMIFWNVKTEIHYKNVATEALDRNSWI